MQLCTSVLSKLILINSQFSMKFQNSNLQNQKYLHIKTPAPGTIAKWSKNHCDNMCNIFKGANRENTEQPNHSCLS